MMSTLIVKDEITIHASAAKVWDVLVSPNYVRQWDELPEDFPEEKMSVGSEVVWELPNGGVTKTTVIEAERERKLIISLYVSNWDIKPDPADIAYTYEIMELDNGIKLSMKIGDFSLLQNGEDYYEASVEFAQESKQKIKQLAEEE
jgi:uncharacterized protein YndB with AHSA1/START domain